MSASLFGCSSAPAILSEDRAFRYALHRCWDASKRAACFIGLNPSTADETTDDATIRKVTGFARRWGYGGVTMLNLYGWRARAPADLHTEETHRRVLGPIGFENDTVIRSVLGPTSLGHNVGVVVAAWGAFDFARARGEAMRELVAATGHELQCLGYSKDGHPRHPLMLPYATKLETFDPTRGEVSAHG